MFSKLFDSISYPLDAFVFFIFVTTMYFLNKRHNSNANRTYRVLLLFTLLASLTLFFDFLGTDGVPGFKGLENIFARLYILFTMLWSATFSFYLLLGFFNENDSKKIKTVKIIIYSVNILLFIWSCFLELEYHHRTIYAIGGKALTPLYAEFVLTGAIYLISFIARFKKLNKVQLSMHLTIIAILITMTIFRFFTDWDVNYFTYIFCTIPIALYFSSESSAYLLSLELEQSKKEYEISNVEQSKKINDISSQLMNPLSNIITSRKVLEKEGLTETEFKNERIKIYNNTKKIYDMIKQMSQNESEVQK